MSFSVLWVLTVFCQFTDFDLQATLAEAVFRVLEPHEKEEFAKQWFDEASVEITFLQIRNSDFENVSVLFPTPNYKLLSINYVNIMKNFENMGCSK